MPHIARAALISAAFISAAAFAGPFGLNQGDTVEAVGRMTKLRPADSPNTYIASSFPQGHPDFDDYRLVFSPSSGLCKITAWTPPTNTSIYGDEVRSAFAGWQEALTSKYGAPKKFDFLRPGSIWKDGNDWTMALAKKERTLVAFWIKPTGGDAKLSTIKVEAFGISNSSYMINVGYEFSNVDECLDSVKSKKNANL